MQCKTADNHGMTEPETEIDALDRLEAALVQIAAHTHERQIAAAIPAHAGAEPPCTRHEVAASLDRVIAQLRDALASVGQAEQG